MFRIKTMGFIGFVLWALAGLAPVAEASTCCIPPRVALVIGNDGYRYMPHLSSSRNDAKALAEALQTLGFEVTGPLLDLTKGEMEHALREFNEQHQIAAAVVYFSGHGVQVDGRDYLFPVDAQPRNARDVTLEAVALHTVMDQLPPARRYRLVILDASRTMIDPARISSVPTELGKVEVVPTYIAFAAGDGQEALDEREHSPFTTALLKYLRNYRQEPLPLERLFSAVQEDVRAATEGKQNPVLLGEFGKEPVYLTE